MNVAPVCHVGDPLQLTCTASIEFISWSIFHINEQGMLVRAIIDEPINSRDRIQMPDPIGVGTGGARGAIAPPLFLEVAR